MSARIEASGHTAVIAPLLEIAYQDLPDNILQDAAGLIVTSRNAVEALDRHGLVAVPTLPVYAVGRSTAAAAQAMGFDHVVTGPGSAEGLLPVLRSAARPAGAFVYVTGDRLAFDLASALRREGAVVRTVEAYRSVEATSLPDAVVEELRSGAIDAVLLMSPKTAEVWTRVVAQTGLTALVRDIVHVCISDNAATPLSPLDISRVVVAIRPDRDAIYDAIDHLAVGLKRE